MVIVGWNEASIWYRPVTRFVAEVIRGIILRFFTTPNELRALSPERVKRLSRTEVRLLSVNQLQILGIERLPALRPKVYFKALSAPELFQELLEKKIRAQEIVKEKRETLISVIELAEKKRSYIPTICLIESFLTNKRSIEWMVPYLTKECITTIVTRIQHKPIISDFVREAAPHMKEKEREALYWAAPRRLWRRSDKNLSVQKNDNSDKV